jgi:hypothetical protein
MTKGFATARAARTEPNLELRDVRALGLQNFFLNEFTNVVPGV